MTLEETIQFCLDSWHMNRRETLPRDEHQQVAVWLSEYQRIEALARACGWSEEANCTPVAWIENIVQQYYEP